MPINPLVLTDLSFGGDQGIVYHGQPYVPQRGISIRGDNVEQKVNEYVNENNKRVILQFPFERPKYYFMISFQEYNRVDYFSVDAKLNTKNTIILPLPLDIKDSHMVAYDESSLGVVGGNLLQQGASLVNDIQEKGVESITKKITDTFSADRSKVISNKPVGQQLGLTGAAINEITGGSRTLQTGVEMLQYMYGFSPNQFFTVLLRGPTYKRFSLAWHLIPKNFEEARTIRDIVMSLNNNMSPGLAAGGAIFTFPSVARMSFFPNYDFLYKFKPCVITGIDIDYNDRQGTAFYHDRMPSQGTGAARGLAGQNPPESVRLVMECLELEYWLKGDFQVSTAPDNTTGPRGQ